MSYLVRVWPFRSSDVVNANLWIFQISLDDDADLEEMDQTVDPQQWLQDKMAKLLDLGQKSNHSFIAWFTYRKLCLNKWVNPKNPYFLLVVARNISAPFQTKCRDWFIGLRDREVFFGSALRGLLVSYNSTDTYLISYFYSKQHSYQ